MRTLSAIVLVVLATAPPVNHPEFYYGFFGVTLSWQIMFLVIGSSPIRYRMAMIRTRRKIIHERRSSIPIHLDRRISCPHSGWVVPSSEIPGNG
jgi:hypothetical protein